MSGAQAPTPQGRGHPALVRGDARAFDPDAVLHDRVGGIDGYFVVGELL